MPNEIILHLDMDGVLTDFDEGFKKISGGLTPDEYRTKHGRGGEASLFLRDGGNFFAGLDWIAGGRDLLDFATSHFKLVRILSSAGTGKDWEKFKEVQAGKLQWLATNAPQIQKKNIIIVPFANLKAARHSGPDRILVDDKDTTIKNWNIRGGIGILHHHSNWQATIDDLQVLTDGPIKLKEIVEIL